MELEIKCDKNNRIWRIFHRLDRLRKDKDRCDVLIKVGSDEILAHKNVLSANSDYFDKMFAHETKEKQSGICEMKEVDAFCVKKCVDYMYSCEIAAPFEKLGDLLHVATLMQLDDVCSGIVKLLETNLSSESVFETRKVSKMFDLTNLEEICKQFILDKFQEISKIDDFCFLGKEEVVKIIKNKKLKLEDVKLNAVFNWIKFDSKSREVYADNIIGLVDLSKLSLGYRSHVIANEDIVRENAVRLFKFSMSVMDSMNITPSSIAENTGKEGIVVFHYKSGYLHCYNPENNSWVQMQEMNKDMMDDCSNFSAVTVDDFIYVLMENKAVYRLNYLDEDATWEKMADMLEHHGSYPPAVVSNNNIYAIGSNDVISYNYITPVEKYDVNSNIWTRLNNMPPPLDGPKSLEGPGLSVFQNKIYCFGGFLTGHLINIISQYDAGSDVWKIVGDMPVVNSYPAFVTVGESIYILGGVDEDCLESTNTVRRFNPIINHWQSLSPMLVARHGFHAFAIQCFIYAVGGVEGSCGSLEKYNITEDKWELVEIPEGMELDILGSVKIKLKI
uniref:LOW QUALITY PROTEIN: kelch-like protein 12 n=1 Tax=Styela clava TaxID=7725 RepID=UPI00193A3820|nr:LOW QUALITY PROTEIN: kelch-like protein 12 [Styela clava]